MSHTKIPWQLEDDDTTIISPPNGRPYIEVVATKLHRHNARFIVTACNSFEAMKAALGNVLIATECGEDAPHGKRTLFSHERVAEFRAALALAEGKE